MFDNAGAAYGYIVFVRLCLTIPFLFIYEFDTFTTCPDGLMCLSIRVFVCFFAPVTFLIVKFLVVRIFPIDLLLIVLFPDFPDLVPLLIYIY